MPLFVAYACPIQGTFHKRTVSIGATDNNHTHKGVHPSQWIANAEQSFVGGGDLGARNADH